MKKNCLLYTLTIMCLFSSCAPKGLDPFLVEIKIEPAAELLTVTINQSILQNDPAKVVPVEFDIIFEEAIDPLTFTTADITQDGTATGITWNLINSGDNTNYTLQATTITGDGTLMPSISAITIIKTVSLKDNNASTSTDNTVTYDAEFDVTINQSISQNDPAKGVVSYDISFSQVIDSNTFTVSDIDFTGTAKDITATLTNQGDSKNFKLLVRSGGLPTNINNSVNIIATIPADGITSSTGSKNSKSFSTDNEITIKPNIIMSDLGHGSYIMGSDVSVGGDFDGDGKADLLVGGTNCTEPICGLEGPGKVVAYSGEGLIKMFTIVDPSATPKQGAFGAYVSNAPDLNGDGLDEVLISSPMHNITGGNAQVGKFDIFDSAAGHAKLFTAEGTAISESLGSGRGLMDFNEDGKQDLVISGRNKINIYSGDDNSVLKSYNLGDDGIGYDLSVGADFDGDNLPDIIASSDIFKENSGKVNIISTRDESILWNKEGESTGDIFGGQVAVFGDINSDDIPDFIISAKGRNTNTGKVYIYSGANFSLIRSHTGENIGDFFGQAVCDAGDFNGDGVNDYGVGATGFGTNQGKIYIFSGLDGAVLFSVNGPFDEANLGQSCDGGTDFNDDGKDDVVFSANGKGLVGSDIAVGGVYVVGGY
ncbi:MAG: VCBS repeat-containing protein [Bacteriovoracaceae bacterium]|nr:VCBS repeat-containing protein [Bacteriovoracaceae bacterium]